MYAVFMLLLSSISIDSCKKSTWKLICEVNDENIIKFTTLKIAQTIVAQSMNMLRTLKLSGGSFWWISL